MAEKTAAGIASPKIISRLSERIAPPLETGKGNRAIETWVAPRHRIFPSNAIGISPRQSSPLSSRPPVTAIVEEDGDELADDPPVSVLPEQFALKPLVGTAAPPVSSTETSNASSTEEEELAAF